MSKPQPLSFRVCRQLLAGSLLACILASTTACSAPPAMSQAQARVLISFHTDVVGDDPALLARLERLAGIGMRHAAAVSGKLHAYELFCTSRDPGCGQAMQALQTDAAIRDISPDEIRQTWEEAKP